MKKILDFLHSANFGEQTNKETCSENYKNVLKCMIFVIFRARLFVSLLPKARVVKKTDDFLQFANFGEQRYKEACSRYNKNALKCMIFTEITKSGEI